MITKVYLGNKKLVIPFSSRSTASSFIRGFNEHIDAYVSGKEFGCQNENEERGARFAQIIIRYCQKYSVRIPNTRLEIFEDTKDQQSLFDSFE